MTAEQLLSATATTTGALVDSSWGIVAAVLGVGFALWAGYAIITAIVGAVRHIRP